MATHASAEKRQRQNIKRRERNRAARSTIKTLVKKVKAAPNKEEGSKHLIAVISLLSKAAHKGTLHAKNASRNISKLTQFVNRLG